MKTRLTRLDAKELYKIQIKTLLEISEYSLPNDVDSVVEHTKLVTKELNRLAKIIEKTSKLTEHKLDLLIGRI